MSVTTMRIDDRLIHGQIVTRWIADAQADTILIADDMAAGDATTCGTCQYQSANQNDK